MDYGALLQEIVVETNAQLGLALNAAGTVVAASRTPTDEEWALARIVAKAATSKVEKAGLWEAAGQSPHAFAAVSGPVRIVVLFDDVEASQRVIGTVMNAIEAIPGRPPPRGPNDGGGSGPLHDELPLPRRSRKTS